MSKRKRFAPGGSTPTSARIAPDSPPDYEDRPPLFSLEKLQSGTFCLSRLDRDQKASFADALFKRKNLTWREINRAPRHGLGTEKIPRNEIKAPIPHFVTEDREYFLSFRFHGKAPMVGYRVRDVFYVLWFDAGYSLYKHSA